MAVSNGIHRSQFFEEIEEETWLPGGRRKRKGRGTRFVTARLVR
jgi:hypothetical protein